MFLRFFLFLFVGCLRIFFSDVADLMGGRGGKKNVFFCVPWVFLLPVLH